MSENCESCKHWLVAKVTTYDDAEEVTNFRAPDGKGQCQQLRIDTEANFGCKWYFEDSWDHVTRNHKAGLAWQHWEVKECPDCKGYGCGCTRCAGTGKVRHYDDGFIGEEQTRLHPKQKEVLKLGPPTCVMCNKELDVNWVSCPFCGTRTNKPSFEVIGFNVGEVQGTTDELMSKMIAAKKDKEAAGEVLK